MHSILFCLQTMVCGGVEKELITVLKKLNPEQFKITVLLFYKSNSLIIDEIPPYVDLIILDICKEYYFSTSLLNLVLSRIGKGEIKDAFNIVVNRAFKKGYVSWSMSLKDVPTPLYKYDLAICYHVHSPIIIKYVATNIKAFKKIAWIHNDFSTTGYLIHDAIQYVKRYDEFIAVSRRVKEEFEKACPEYGGKTSIIHNIVDAEEIVEKSQIRDINDPFFSDDRIKILTIGRFTKQKGFDRAIEISKSLADQGLYFCWYFMGSGIEEGNYRKLIKQYSLEKHIVIMGEKANPYPYIKYCDMYIQPSRHEAWGLVVQEARVLCKPIIVTNFAGSEEQIVNGETGYIIPNDDIDSLEECIKMLINNENERNRLENNLKTAEKKSNDIEIIQQKLAEILNC